MALLSQCRSQVVSLDKHSGSTPDSRSLWVATYLSIFNAMNRSTVPFAFKTSRFFDIRSSSLSYQDCSARKKGAIDQHSSITNSLLRFPEPQSQRSWLAFLSRIKYSLDKLYAAQARMKRTVICRYESSLMTHYRRKPSCINVKTAVTVDLECTNAWLRMEAVLLGLPKPCVQWPIRTAGLSKV